MAVSILHGTLLILILVFLVTHSIDGYRLHQTDDIPDVDDDDNDVTSHHPINLRSVLWPKICFTTLMKKNIRQATKDDHGQENNNDKHRSKRNARKCYPFDTV